MSVSISPITRPGSFAPGEIPQEVVLAALETIVASDAFAKVERPARFLRHLVENQLRGDGHLLKESLLGVEVFERDPSWDPRLDPVVRQEAARLRKRLARFYQTQGSVSVIRIELPVGTYVPVFCPFPPLAKPEPTSEEPQPAPLSALPILPAPWGVSHPRAMWVGAAALMALTFLSVLTILHFQYKTKFGGESPKGEAAAEDLYLKGRFYWNRRTPESLTQAVDFFTQAVVRDPKYAAAYVGLADSYNLLREYSAMAPEQAYPRAEAAARRALELDDRSAEAHNSLAFVEFWWNWNATMAEAEFGRAIRLRPGYAVAHHWYATFLNQIGRGQDALREISTAQRLDPGSNSIVADKAFILSLTGRREEAIALLKQLEAVDQSFLSSHQYLAEVYLASQDYPDFLAEFGTAARLAKSADAAEVADAARQGFARGGSRAMYKAILEVQRKNYSEGRLPALALAATYSRLGRRPEALQYLKQSFQNKECALLEVLRADWTRPLRAKPGFESLQAALRGVLRTGLHR